MGQNCFGPKPRRFFGDKHWAEPLAWATAARKTEKRAKVFCASMCDLFEPSEGTNVMRARLVEVIYKTHDALDWLLLTKRPENLWLLHPDTLRLCWVGVTVEDQVRADERIPLLLASPARVRFVSMEPLLERVTLRPWLGLECRHEGSSIEQDTNAPICRECDEQAHLDWAIVGGESGPRAREFDLAWARAIRDQCEAASVPVFVKQLGRCASDAVNGIAGHGLEVPREAESLISRRLADLDGRDPAEWPADLRVQQLPRP
jgi:protein gp37